MIGTTLIFQIASLNDMEQKYLPIRNWFFEKSSKNFFLPKINFFSILTL